MPLEAAAGAGDGRAKDFSFAASLSDHAVLDTLKGAEDGDGLILRVYESQGARGEAAVRFGREIESAVECNLMEVDEAAARAEGDTLKFYIKPYEIKTFRIHLQ